LSAQLLLTDFTKNANEAGRISRASTHRMQLPPNHQLVPNIASILKSEISPLPEESASKRRA
jgi:hypothetical protein